jgi:hypothetical protein
MLLLEKHFNITIKDTLVVFDGTNVNVFVSTEIILLKKKNNTRILAKTK